jgi:predicted transcriptional regulator
VGEIKPHEGSMFLIDKNCDLLNAFSVMQQTGAKRLIVIDSLLSRHVLGTVTSDDVIAAFLKVMHGVPI